MTCIQPEDGFSSQNMLLMVNYKESCVWAWFIFILFTSVFKTWGCHT